MNYKLPPLPDVDLRDVGTKVKDIREFLSGYATAYAIAAIEAQQEPIAWSTGIEWHPISHYQSEQVQKLTRKSQPEYGFTVPLYTHPAPQAKPQPLSDEQMWKLWNAQGSDDMNQKEAIAFARAIEAAHGITKE